jgi:hypothetical protein
MLALLSICAYQGDFGGVKHPEQGPVYLAAAAVVIIVGVWVIAILARGIVRDRYAHSPSTGLPPPPVPPAAVSGPLQFSPAARKAIQNLVTTMGAQIAASIAIWLVNRRVFWNNDMQGQSWTLLFLAPFILYHLPYGVLIWGLVKRPDRRVFTYSLAVPAVLILHTLFTSSLVGYFFIHHPVGLTLWAVPCVMDAAILVLAYRAIQLIGFHPEPKSLIVAAVVSFLYFLAIPVFTPFLYRFARMP